MRSTSAGLIALGLVVVACGDDSREAARGASTTSTTTTPATCPPGEAETEGGCRPAGVPASACGAGFSADDSNGCAPVLPAEPCAEGTMAVPGDAQCRPVAPCDGGPWGAAPIEPGTQFVDAAYAGADSDGSEQHPWLTVGEGVAAAIDGAVVAIAAGSYEENVTIEHPVRLWGRCPELVELVGGNAPGAIVVKGGNVGVELHDLAVRGPNAGVVRRGAGELALDRVWIHDTGERGLYIDDFGGAGSAALSRSLVERVAVGGVYVAGATVDVEATVVRAIQPKPVAAGVIAELNPATGRSPTLGVRGSVVEDCEAAGVSVAGGTATVEASVVRANVTAAGALDGVGILTSLPPDAAGRNTLTVRASVVEGNESGGIVANACDVSVETTVIRGNGVGHSIGAGVAFQSDAAAGESVGTVRDSVVTGNGRVGLFVVGSHVELVATRVADTTPDGGGLFGRGVMLQSDTDGRSAALTAGSSVIAHNHDHGIVVLGAELTFDHGVVRDTQLQQAAGVMGDGIAVVGPGPSRATVTDSLIEHNARCGLSCFGATIELATTRLSCNAIALDGETLGGVDCELHDGGGDVCDCDGKQGPCAMQSSSLAPPAPAR